VQNGRFLGRSLFDPVNGKRKFVGMTRVGCYRIYKRRHTDPGFAQCLQTCWGQPVYFATMPPAVGAHKRREQLLAYTSNWLCHVTPMNFIFTEFATRTAEFETSCQLAWEYTVAWRGMSVTSSIEVNTLSARSLSRLSCCNRILLRLPGVVVYCTLLWSS
jgi:hypothetical protein